MCEKSPNLPAKCALCAGDHPANYRGYPTHKEFQASLQSKKISNQQNYPPPPHNVKPNIVNATSNSSTNPPKSYAQATSVNANISSDNHQQTEHDILPSKLSSFLDDFKNLINPLISLLTTLINSLILSKNDK